jgi:hypothetical protein
MPDRLPCEARAGRYSNVIDRPGSQPAMRLDRTSILKCTFAPLLVALSTLGGCATITSNELQTVTLNARTVDGSAVDKALCTLKNDKGSWTASTPGNVAIRRSSEDLTVECKKEGMSDGFLRAISRAAGGMWGNILLGGGIGAIIDHNKGTGYNYPHDLPVRMGESVTIDRKNETGPAEPSRTAQSSGSSIADAADSR